MTYDLTLYKISLDIFPGQADFTANFESTIQ